MCARTVRGIGGVPGMEEVTAKGRHVLKKTAQMQLYGCRLIVAAPHKIEMCLEHVAQ